MQRDTVLIQPKIYVAMALVVVPMLIVFFRPTFLELLGFLAIDYIGYILVNIAEISLFHRNFPESRLFFPALDPRIFEVDSFTERVRIYQAMARLPLQRAVYIIGIWSLKVTPAFLYGFWVWSDDYSYTEIILKGFAICAFTFSYGAGMGFLGYHNQVTEFLANVHRKCDWSQVFRAVNPMPKVHLFQKFELLAVVGVLVFWLGMICMIPFSDLSPWWSLAQILYMSGFAIYFIGQIYLTSQRQVSQGLESIIKYHTTAGAPLDPRGLPLSTNPTLAFYQKRFNDMVERNVASEQEIHRWILRKAEDSRYLQLGRITGLFIHDLATPLTIMGLSVAQLEERPADQTVSHRYVERLRFCLQQITEFIGNLRLSIRDSAVHSRQASPYLAHEAALRMLSYLHESSIYSTFQFECRVDKDLRVSFPQPELNQVILNLYSNAVSNLLENNVSSPSLRMRWEVKVNGQVDLILQDNGTGLSMHNFQFITEEAERLPGKEGIGLKLTKRLVELYGGSLNLIEPDGTQGSAFVIRLATAHIPTDPAFDFKLSGGSKTLPVNPEMPADESARRLMEACLES